MRSESLWFIIFHLLPSLVVIVFASRMVEINARAYPRLYGPIGRRIALVVLYITAVLWVMIGIKWFLK